MKYEKKYSKSDWENLAKVFSDEDAGEKVNSEEFNIQDSGVTENSWRSIRSTNQTGKIDVDAAWNKISSRIEGMADHRSKTVRITSWNRVLQVAAAFILLAVSASIVYFTVNSGFLQKTVVIATNQDQINKEVTLPDGSTVYLNRNTEISYKKNFKEGRELKLNGEAYFNILHDPLNPFIVDAGSASVKVLGTSFNVITGNIAGVEVLVTSGKVLLAGKSDKSELLLDPGYIGTAGSGNAKKTFNTDRNYMAWNTGSLFYENEQLEVVFGDLKRVFNISIVAEDPSILKEAWTSPINKMPDETIIQLICFSFNLGYVKEGEVYHLSKK